MAARIANNFRLLFWGRVLIEVKLLAALVVLFYQHRGLGMDDIFYLSIVWSIISLLTEVPSGYLADRLGRKNTLLVGVFLLLVAQTINLFAFGFWWFVLSYVFFSSSFSCFSGTEEALLYESLKYIGKEQEMNGRHGKQFAARALPAIFLPALGALFAHSLLEWQFQLLIGLNLLAALLALLILSKLTEPPHVQHVSKQETGIFAHSIQTIRSEPWLLKVALNKLLVFIAVFLVWRISQPLLIGLGFTPIALGVFYIVTQSLSFVGGWFARQIDERFGTTRVLFLTPLLMAVLIGWILVSDHGWSVFFALAIVLALNDYREPLFAFAVNQRIQSKSRATTLSNLHVIKAFLDIPMLLLAGLLSTFSLLYPLLLAAGLCTFTLFALPIRSRELNPALAPALS